MNKDRGKFGEDLSEELLLSKGYTVVARNYRGDFGEIDIVATKEDILVFVEVKARSTIDYGYPYEAVDLKKQERIIKTAYEFLQKHDYKGYQVRFDIIEIYLMDRKYRHIENAFGL